VHKIRIIEIFANESIMTALIIITLFIAKIMAKYICKYSKNQITYAFYSTCSNHVRRWNNECITKDINNERFSIFDTYV